MDRVVEGPARVRARPRAADGRATGQLNEQETVLDPRERRAREDRTIDHLLAGLRERDEMAGEVAAVDRRDVLRVERTAVFRVVPVVEVAAEALEGVHGRDGGFQALDR